MGKVEMEELKAEMEVEEKKMKAIVVVGEKIYPNPLALHEDVIENPTIFMDTLRIFHNTLGTTFMIPVLGRKELDLHLLYREVTARGGFETTVREKKWKDVIAAFKFPPTTTSASFVMRKYYITLLHHYEQVYFFRLQGELVPPSVKMAVKSPPCKPPAKAVLVESAPDTMLQQQQQEERKSRKRKRAAFSDTDVRATLNVQVAGVIDGKFDNGYFVTVTFGSDTLRGVLYHVPPVCAVTPENAILPVGIPIQSRRKRQRRQRDPSHPKPNRSAYNFFFAEKHSKLKLLYPNREREFSKMIGESWSKLTEEEKMVYKDCGLKDKERYQREMQEYRERLKQMQDKEAIGIGTSTSIEVKADA